ncbi:methyltransferase domain-containing protein [Candidatus Bathyarchaeota archaeon]|nr:methyltransferase domain-containing protein [Candidatus Bathyarchaeota archaeon]
MTLSREKWAAKLRTMRHYDTIAHRYDELYGDEQLTKMKLVEQEIRIEPDDVVLDVGCGTGLLFDLVAPKAKLLVGLDISSKQLKVAYKKMKDFPNVQLVMADAEHMPFRERVFDKVIAVTLLQNLLDPERFLRESIRISKPRRECAVTALKKMFDRGRLVSLFGKMEVDFRFLEERTKDYIVFYRSRSNEEV